MYTYLIDSRVPPAPQPSGIAGLARYPNDSHEEAWRRVIAALPGHGDAYVIWVDPLDRFATLVDMIVAGVGSGVRIRALRIMAHGAPGQIAIGRGIRRPDTLAFRRLGPVIATEGGGVEFHSCEVAGSREGRTLLQMIADAAQRPVRASTVVQQADNLFAMEGDVLSFPPHPLARHSGVRPH